MPSYQYKAKQQDAETVFGHIVAADKEEAIEKVIQLGLVPIAVEEGYISLKGKLPRRRKSVSLKEQLIFTRQLVNLLKSGISILRILEIIADQTPNLYFRSVIENIHFAIKSGHSFSESLSEYPDIFPALYVVMVRAGEESGRLREVLEDLREYLRSQHEMNGKVKTAMMYPLLMLVVGTATIVFVLTYVMPQISSLFEHLGQALPLPTLIVMKSSDFLLTWWAWIGVVLLSGGLTFKKWLKTSSGRRAISQLQLDIPLINTFWVRVDLGRFCRTFGLLLKSGVPVVRAMQLSVPVVENIFIQEELNRCQDNLIAGTSLGESLRRAKHIPVLLRHLLAVGEESGSLGQTLDDISETYDQEIADILKTMTTLLEPVMILLVGSVVGFIVIAMLLPIFQLDVFAR